MKKNSTIRRVFRTGKFRTGFVIFMLLLIFCFGYPLFIDGGDPLEMVSTESYMKPGLYVNQYEVASEKSYEMNIDASELIMASALKNGDDAKIINYLTNVIGLDLEEMEVDTTDNGTLVSLFLEHYDPENVKGMRGNERRDLKDINTRILKATRGGDLIIAGQNDDGELVKDSTISNKNYVRVGQVKNTYRFILGSDNFGRDVVRELAAATKSSLFVGLIAGLIATSIGLTLGLIAGFIGGTTDNVITFITNLFTVIPSFVILVLISYSVGQNARGVGLVAVIIGLTAWPWTCRSVRSQVISLRNRDHINLMKLSGHSTANIIITGILPYIASYVVMAMILQIAQGILSEAQLSMLGLGASTTKTATLGLMMNWATKFSAVTNGSWWAYFPVILVIALITFSMNLMNTGLDQVFNPQLRD